MAKDRDSYEDKGFALSFFFFFWAYVAVEGNSKPVFQGLAPSIEKKPQVVILERPEEEQQVSNRLSLSLSDPVLQVIKITDLSFSIICVAESFPVICDAVYIQNKKCDRTSMKSV